MRKYFHSSIVMFMLLICNKMAFAQGLGGPVLPVEPCHFRVEFDAGFIYPQFARFKFGDTRNVFPVNGGQVIEEAFNERHYSPSYYLGGRASYNLLNSFCCKPTEIYARFGVYDAHRHSSFNENEPAPEVYVPYIDGNVRDGLVGGAVVGLFANSDLQLRRKQFSYEVETGVRRAYTWCCWNFAPGLFFDYQRIQQRDVLDTTGSTDPVRMEMRAHVNSNHYNFGVNFNVLRPLFCRICWLGNFAVGAEYVSAHYKGEQRFAGGVFVTAEQQLALVDDTEHHWGGTVALETGFRALCFRGISVSVLGNFRYRSALPYVKYPVPIVGTPNVTGPARVNFQDQLAFGGEVNLGYTF